MKIRPVIATAKIVFVILLAQTAAADAAEVKLLSAAAKEAEAAKALIKSKTQVEPLQSKDAPALKSYADVQALLNDFMKQNNGPIEFAPHGTFWNEMSHKQFIEGNVPEVSDQATGKPLKVLIVGNAKESNIIMAFRGTKGSIFDRETGSIGRMPPVGPFMSDEEINRLADWIDRGCPDGP